MQGLRGLAQVALAFLEVSQMFCFPGITSGTVSSGPIPKNPGRAPNGGCGVPASGVGGCGCAAQLSMCCLGGGGSGSPALAQPLRRSLFGYTLRERRGHLFHAPRVRLLQEF